VISRDTSSHCLPLEGQHDSWAAAAAWLGLASSLGLDGVRCSAIELEEIAAQDAIWALISLQRRRVGSRLDVRELKSLIPVATGTLGW
jgi:hypothetical protein